MEKDIQDLTKEELLNPDFLPSIFDNYPDENERTEVINALLEIAKSQKVLSKFKKILATYNNNRIVIDGDIVLRMDNSGKNESSTENYITIMRNDEELTDLFAYDTFGDNIIYTGGNHKRLWDDKDDSNLRAYIEKKYGIYNQQKYYDAFNVVLKERSFHPIKELIEDKPWDGVPRIDTFLTDMLACDSDNYTREVSRMIFYGGISRLYNPGCKFDYMPIFIGKQGTYKSTIINWLALDDKYYNDVSTIEGKDGMDAIQGRWICEFAELLAMVRTKDVEAMKSFITRTTDKYRKSYDKRPGEFPRQCIFMGTTNDCQFLSDKTGNRRYLPVTINLTPGCLAGREQEIKDYILFCWREALELFRAGKTYLTIPSDYYNDIVVKQESVVEDDPKVGLVLDYLSKKQVGDKVCGLEVFTNCFNGLKKNFNRLEAKEISRILSSRPDWERRDSTARFEQFGIQKYWEKIDPNATVKITIKTDDLD